MLFYDVVSSHVDNAETTQNYGALLGLMFDDVDLGPKTYDADCR